MTKQFPYLEKYTGQNSRFTCPRCGERRQLALYIDPITGERFPNHVGRCNNEEKCQYHFKPRDYYAETGLKPDTDRFPVKVQTKPKPVDFIDVHFVEKSIKGLERNCLYQFLKNKFGEHATLDLFRRYIVGSSGHWFGSTAFWQMDEQERIRQVKIMLYDPQTGKRIKKGAEVQKYDKKSGRYYTITTEIDCCKVYGKCLPGVSSEANFVQCFFGQHLLSEHPDKTVCIVESEKTALICSHFYPNQVWIATGGINGARWTHPDVFHVLKGRKIRLFPDASAYEKWKLKAEYIRSHIDCDISISDYLERNATDEEKAAGIDLADVLLKKHNKRNDAEGKD